MPLQFCMRFFVLGLLVAKPLSSAVIGTSRPAESITAARIATLPKKDRALWMAYLVRSEKQMHLDRAALTAEQMAGAVEPAMPNPGFAGRSMPLDRDAAWYGTAEARHVADKEIDGRAALERKARFFRDNRDNADEESHLLAVAFTERHRGLREQ